MFRIQKLLMAEYEDIYEPVIIENPFVLVDENGQGIRQYQIGLTSSRIIFGCDDFDNDSTRDVFYRDVDPEIETFELVSLLPLQLVRLSFFRQNKRSIMRVTVYEEEDKSMLFEFGGHLYKKLFWNTWRERVSNLRILYPELYHITDATSYTSSDIVSVCDFFEIVMHPQRNCSPYPLLTNV